MRKMDTYWLRDFGWQSLRTGRVIVPPPPIVHFTHGREITAEAVGIAGRGLTADDLAPSAGGVFNVDGAVLTGMKFSGEVILNGDNITVEHCLSEGSGENFIAFRINGSGIRIKYTSVIPAEEDTSGYVAFLMNGGEDVVLDHVYATRYENLVTSVGYDGIVRESLLEWPDDISNLSPGGGHKDVFEIYAGSCLIDRVRARMGADETVVINIAPWGAPDVKVDYAIIQDSSLGGGISHILVDYQGVTEDVYNVRVLRNDMDGHTFPGYAEYWALNNHATDDDENGPRPIVETVAEQEANPRAILWPTSGPNANHWADCSDLTPDRTGQIIFP